MSLCAHVCIYKMTIWRTMNIHRTEINELNIWIMCAMSACLRSYVLYICRMPYSMHLLIKTSHIFSQKCRIIIINNKIITMPWQIGYKYYTGVFIQIFHFTWIQFSNEIVYLSLNLFSIMLSFSQFNWGKKTISFCLDLLFIFAFVLYCQAVYTVQLNFV